MRNPSLLHLLGVAPRLPTLLIWGREDRVVPLSAAEDYQRAMTSARLSVFDNCGHRPEVEKPVEFVREVEGFFN